MGEGGRGGVGGAGEGDVARSFPSDIDDTPPVYITR